MTDMKQAILNALKGYEADNPNQPVCEMDGKEYTAVQVIYEIENDTDLGRKFYVSLLLELSLA